MISPSPLGYLTFGAGYLACGAVIGWVEPVLHRRLPLRDGWAYRPSPIPFSFYLIFWPMVLLSYAMVLFVVVYQIAITLPLLLLFSPYFLWEKWRYPERQQKRGESFEDYVRRTARRDK
jgi:hypothetical protein